jgi:tetratricopeptide (TPR) repeat protein
MGRQVLFGSYELLERIGEGGMAEVWRARSRGVAGFEKEVVIKRVLPSLMAREDFAELLIHEAKVAARLNHPGIVQIFELGEEQGAYFIAMELVQGCDLASALAAQPNPLAQGVGLSLPLRLWIVMEAARALDYAHRQRTEEGRPLGIVHRDISPQNVLLGYEGQVKVADFGIALAQGLGGSEDGNTLRGKYAYMSPEQARAETLDHRSDIFSLGIVLYELLAGRRLFRAKSPEATLERVVSGSVPELDLAGLGLPTFMQGILERSLERDRESRYPSAGLMADDLSRVLVEMEAHIGDADLREAIARIAPPADASRANKARISLFTQTDQERMGHGDTPVAITEPTMAFSTSKRLRAEERAALVAVMPDDAGPHDQLRALARRHGGLLLPAMKGTYEVIFGHEGDAEHAAERAVRFGLDVRHQRKDTPLALLRGGARVFDGDLAEPLEETRAEALAHLSDGLRVHPALTDELSWRFHIESGDEHWPTIGEARSRAEREIQHLRDGPLVGRRDELERLLTAFASAAEGEGASVLVTGPPGAGKSRLIAELAHAATCEGATVLSAHGRSGSTGAYAALGSLFGDLCGVEASDPAEVTRDKVDRLRVLGLGQRSIAEVAQLLGLESEIERPFGRPRGLALAHAFERAMQALSEDAPVLVVFEDVHWMDDETRQLLDLLTGPLRSKRVLTVLSARPGVALPPLGSVDTLPLQRLEPLVAQRLFARALGARAFEGEVGEVVEQACEGNAAGVSQLAVALQAAGSVAISEGVLHQLPELEALPLPERMAAAVAARVSALPKSVRDVLAACAALGEHATTTTLAALTHVPVDLMRRPMMRLLTARWLRPIGGAVQYELTGRWGGGDAATIPEAVRVAGGDLVRRCVLTALPARKRKRLHASAVAALQEVEGAPPELLARHARLGELANAAEHCLAAAKALRQEGAIERAAWWTLEGARAAEALGDDALGWRITAAELALEAGDAELVESALQGTESVADPSLVVRAGLVHARLRARESFWSEAVDILERSADVLEDVEDDGLRGQLWLALGWSLMETGDVEHAIDTLDAAVGCFEVAPPAAPGSRRGSLWVPEPGAELGDALAAFAIGLARAGEDARAAEASHRALVRAAAHGGARLRWRALYAAAEVASCEGADYAFELWVDAATLARDLGMDEALAQTAVRAAVACVDAGRENEAAVWAAAAKGAATGRGLDAVACLAETVQAELALAAHPDTHFVRGLVRSVERLESLGRAGEAAMGLDMLARAHLALGDVGAAIRTLGRAAPMADGAGRPRLASQLRARAETLARTGAR